MQPNDGKDKKADTGKVQAGDDLLKEISGQIEAPSNLPAGVPPVAKPAAPTLDTPSNPGGSTLSSLQNQGLLDVKHKALAKLSDLVDNLEHSPEQHFQTLMMIIQETENMGLIDKAYSTALQLKDAKERAQALLAVANEINYFTSK